MFEKITGVPETVSGFRVWCFSVFVKMYEKIDLCQKLSVSGNFPALTGSGFGRFYCILGCENQFLPLFISLASS
jgi:hypothetical protein